MPELFIITGSNGAGKSSIGINYLPDIIRNNYPIFDGDKLFMQKQKELWASGITVHKEAKKLAFAEVSKAFDDLVEDALAKNDNFVYEGHFTNDATWDIPNRFKKAGYSINMIFLGLVDPNLSELRVIDRVSEGGHFVPRNTIEDNFYGNLEKLDKYFHLINNLVIIDTSEATHTILINKTDNIFLYCIAQDSLPNWVKEYLPNIMRLLP